MAARPRFVEYRCRSCKSWCLLEHAEPAAKYHECRNCHAVPVLDRDRVDYRVTELLWAIEAAPLDLPAGAERGLAPDREARAHEGPKGPRTSGGAVPTQQTSLGDWR